VSFSGLPKEYGIKSLSFTTLAQVTAPGGFVASHIPSNGRNLGAFTFSSESIMTHSITAGKHLPQAKVVILFHKVIRRPASCCPAIFFAGFP
jgi:hypothetical protein